MESNPQYGIAKAGLIGLVRSCGDQFLSRDGITLNAICPAFVITGLCPPFIRDTFPEEHVTPMSTIMKAYDAFLDDDNMTGQTVECTLDELHFRQKPEYSNASQRWMGNGSCWRRCPLLLPFLDNTWQASLHW
jgi:15-hydroxyprostaglandin dehydrogenase (NAD)